MMMMMRERRRRRRTTANRPPLVPTLNQNNPVQHPTLPPPFLHLQNVNISIFSSQTCCTTLQIQRLETYMYRIQAKKSSYS